MERVKDIEKNLVKDMKLCSNVMHEMEDKLEHAYLDEDVIEMKRCESALETLDNEYFQIKENVLYNFYHSKKVNNSLFARPPPNFI